MARKFSTLRAKMSPERQKRVRQRTDRLLAEMNLHEVRKARQLTQERLAEILQIKQASVSKLERRADMYVSTLRAYVEAMGGTLDISISFPDRKPIKLTQFETINALAADGATPDEQHSHDA